MHHHGKFKGTVEGRMTVPRTQSSCFEPAIDQMGVVCGLTASGRDKA